MYYKQHSTDNSFLNFSENRVLYIDKQPEYNDIESLENIDIIDDFKKEIELNITQYIKENFEDINFDELMTGLNILRKQHLKKLKLEQDVEQDAEILQKQISFLEDEEVFKSMVETVLGDKDLIIPGEEIYDASQSVENNENNVINFHVENLKNMSAKNLMATLEHYLKNYKKNPDEKISPDFINKIFKFTGESLGLQSVLSTESNINLPEEFESIKDIKEVQDFISLCSLSEDVKTHIPEEILLRKERSAIFKLLKLQSLNDEERDLLLKSSSEKERLEIATLFNDKRNKVKEFFKKLIIRNIIEEDKYLEDAEKNNELFKKMLFSALGDPDEKGKYNINVGGTNFKIQVSVGPIKTKSSIEDKLNNKWDKLEVKELINDVLRCRVIVESPSNLTDEDVNALNERMGRIFTTRYKGKKYVSRIDATGASTKEGANRPGAKSTGKLQSVDAKYATAFEVQVIPSVISMNNLNLGLKNHEYYAWIKKLNTKLETFIPGNGITESEIKSFINDFMNDIDLNYNESYVDFRELALSNIYKDLIEDFGNPNNEYFSANYIIKNKDKNLNAIEQPRLYNEMLTGIQLKIQNAAMFKKIKDIIYTLPVIEKQDEASIKKRAILEKRLEFKAMKFRRTIELDNSYQQDFINFLQNDLGLNEEEVEEIKKIHQSIFTESEIDKIIKGEDIAFSENQINLLREAKKQDILPKEFVKLANKYM